MISLYLVGAPGDVPDVRPGDHGGEEEVVPPVDLQEAPAVVTDTLLAAETGAGQQGEQQERQSEGGQR